jgi:DNA-3-methyladenine glycosylase II
METHDLTTKRPFDFRKTLGFMCSFPPTRGEQDVAGEAFTKAFSLGGLAVVARVSLHGDRLRVETDSPQLLERIRFQLGLDDDVEGFYARASRDGAFAPLIEELHGLRHVKFGTGPFEAACWAVLTQRTRIPVARAIKDRIVDALGPSTTAFGRVHRAFPEPGAIVDRADELSSLIGPRAPALVQIARAFLDVDERFLRDAPYDDVEGWLRALPRIGPWSSAFVLFRALGRMERTPTDIGPIARAAQKVYGGSEKQALAHAESYGEHRGYWCYYLRAGIG